MLGLVIPDGWPPRWHRWYRPVRKHLCRLVGHRSMFVDAPYLVCLWCDAAIPYPTKPEPEPPNWSSTGRPNKLQGPQGPLP